ncbi:MAG: hypothetical protein O2794_04190 [bacterium]|nr:hypothetical protein [bacterium]
MNKLKKVLPWALMLAPLAVYAQSDIEGFLNGTIVGIINSVIAFLIVVASLIFIFGVIKYITAAGDAEKTAEARSFVIYALIGLVVIFVFWGLVNVIINSLGLSNDPPPRTTF